MEFVFGHSTEALATHKTHTEYQFNKFLTRIRIQGFDLPQIIQHTYANSEKLNYTFMYSVSLPLHSSSESPGHTSKQEKFFRNR